MSNLQPHDPDDYFRDTRMSFGDHIEELRSYLWRAIYGFGLAVFFSFFIGKFAVAWITAPIEKQLEDFYNRRQEKLLSERRLEILDKVNNATPFRKVYFYKPQIEAMIAGKDATSPRPIVVTPQEKLAAATPPTLLDRLWPWISTPQPNKKPNLQDYDGKTVEISPDEREKVFIPLWMSIDSPLYTAGDTMGAVRELLEIDKPTTLNVQEAFFVWFKVCLVCGLILGSPIIFHQIWMFVAAGLYPHEKRMVRVYLPVSLGLFLGGVLVCYYLVIPRAIEALLWFNEWLGFKPDLRLNEWLSFAILMPVIFGVAFQTPLVMIFLNRLGIMNAASFRDKRRYIWFAMLLFAAICTPSTDAYSMLFLWVPMILLFELGIILMQFSPPIVAPVEDDQEADELVEV